jgi:hypothetical protein
MRFPAGMHSSSLKIERVHVGPSHQSDKLLQFGAAPLQEWRQKPDGVATMDSDILSAGLAAPFPQTPSKFSLRVSE